MRNHREQYENGKEKFSSYVVAMKKKELESYGMILGEDNINKIAKKADEYFNNLIFVKTCQGLFIEKAFGEAIIKLGHT